MKILISNVLSGTYLSRKGASTKKVCEVPSKDEMQGKKDLDIVTCYTLISSKADEDNQLKF